MKVHKRLSTLIPPLFYLPYSLSSRVFFSQSSPSPLGPLGVRACAWWWCAWWCVWKKKKKKSERVGRSAKCGAVAAGACIHPYIYNAMDASMCFLLVLPLLPPPPFHLFVNGRQLLLFPGLCLNCIVVFGQGECLLATQPFTFFNPDLHELDLCRLAKL